MLKKMEPTHKKTGFLDALEQLDRGPASSHGGNGREGGEWGASRALSVDLPLAKKIAGVWSSWASDEDLTSLSPLRDISLHSLWWEEGREWVE